MTSKHGIRRLRNLLNPVFSLLFLSLPIHADYNKQLGVYKTAHVLQRDYGIHIRVGRVYRLMKSLQLPKMSTDKPRQYTKRSGIERCPNHLQQQFQQKAPNLVWASDFTCLKAGGKWYYLCILTDLFSRKIIAWHISAKPDVDLVMTAFKIAYEKRNAPCGLMFHSDQGTPYTAFAFRQLLGSLHVLQSFSKKDILLTTHAANVSLSILKRKKPTAEATAPYKNCSSLFLNI